MISAQVATPARLDALRDRVPWAPGAALLVDVVLAPLAGFGGDDDLAPIALARGAALAAGGVGAVGGMEDCARRV